MNYEKSPLFKATSGLVDLLWSVDFLMSIGGGTIAAVVSLVHHFKS